MRIAIMGTGGTGGYFGARLARAGYHVTFIARGAHLKAMQTTGLRVTGVEEFHLPEVRVVENPDGLAPVDVVLFAVKAYDTDGAAELIRPIVGPDTMIVPIQNGIDSYDRLGAIHGHDRVIGALCRISVEIAAPGTIQLNSQFREIIMGEPEGRGESIRIREFANALDEAGMQVSISTDIQVDLWKKFTFITAMSGVCGAARAPIGPIREVPEAFELYRRIAEEVVAVAAAEGIFLAPGFADRLFDSARTLPGTMKASLLVDLERGRRTEVETLQGAVVRMGRKHGIATPVTEVAYGLIKLFQGA